jgi:hypothetical protein
MGVARVGALLWPILFVGAAAAPLAAAEPFTLAQAQGYQGIWYAVGKPGDQYGYKYSGGMPTYPQQHSPIAIYVAAADKTFFVYGGTPPGEQRLLHMVSYFDHATKSVPRPRILLDKGTADAHDNPTLAVDPRGHLWIFSNSHGTSRPSFIHKSAAPYSIAAFERVLTTNFSYGQPWVLDDGSFLLMHTRYKSDRQMWWITSRDGRSWSDGQPLAHIAQGHYQQSWADGRRVATAFNYHPQKGGLDARTNLYYLETSDAGKTWQTASGQAILPPLTEIHNPALARDYESEGLLVYLKQLRFDARGRPVILYQTSRGHEPGPANDPRTWRIARWDGRAWEFNDVTTSDHNYDFGAMYLDEPDGAWRLIAPTDPGAQSYTTGGQMVLWTSADEGRTWRKVKSLTHDRRYNHSFARQPLHAHRDFYALWGDGDPLQPSESSLYFTDRAGSHVWKLPREMPSEIAAPEIAF